MKSKIKASEVADLKKIIRQVVREELRKPRPIEYTISRDQCMLPFGFFIPPERVPL